RSAGCIHRHPRGDAHSWMPYREHRDAVRRLSGRDDAPAQRACAGTRPGAPARTASGAARDARRAGSAAAARLHDLAGTGEVNAAHLTAFSQQPWACRCEWGVRAAEALAPAAVTIVVDVFSFTTCVEI